uniref:Uncharacterized protein n=1 Tax=Marseillevirus LCMAC101 TaxID=2506602 RepID=A0A481YUE0_9VIRU|nr:MAG: hypothetical protein LCMAC101_07390 [Marseillevirus LCMAC101]
MIVKNESDVRNAKGSLHRVHIKPSEGYTLVDGNRYKIYADDYIYRTLSIACEDHRNPACVSSNNITYKLCKLSCVLGEYNEKYRLAFDFIYDLKKKKLIYNFLGRASDPNYIEKFLEDFKSVLDTLFVYIHVPMGVRLITEPDVIRNIYMSFEYQEEKDELIMLSNLGGFNTDVGLLPSGKVLPFSCKLNITSFHELTEEEIKEYYLQKGYEYYLVLIPDQDIFRSALFTRKYPNLSRGYDNMIIKKKEKWFLVVH